MPNNMTFKEYYGEEACDQIRQRVEEFFDNDQGGYIIIANTGNRRISDAYMDICDVHVVEQVTHMVGDAIAHGHPGLVKHEKDHAHA